MQAVDMLPVFKIGQSEAGAAQASGPTVFPLETVGRTIRCPRERANNFAER